MSKEVISVDGKDEVVRGDTARSYRGILWALASLAAFIVIAVILFFGFFSKQAIDGNIQRPSTIENSTRR